MCTMLTIFLTCSGVSGDLGRMPGGSGGVLGLSAMLGGSGTVVGVLKYY